MSDFSNPSHGQDGFDPNQPRIPAGHPDGGQWTDKPGGGGAAPKRDVVVDRSGKEPWGSYVDTFRPDGTLAEQRVFNRDRSRIVSQFDETDASGWDERHTVVTADGSRFIFENTGDVQKIYDQDGRLLSASVLGDAGPEAPKVQLALLRKSIGAAAGAVGAAAAAAAGRLATQKAIEGGLVLFTWLSSRNSADRTAVISLPARVLEYRDSKTNTDPAERAEPVRVSALTGKELKKICERHVDVQNYTNEAAREAKLARDDWTPSQFGTAVHTIIAQKVNGLNPLTQKPRSPDEPADPNFRAEFSLLKALAEDPFAALPRYGQQGTIRIDVLENPENGTVCVYDIKTGRQPLTLARIKEIGEFVVQRYGSEKRIIIMEVRPR